MLVPDGTVDASLFGVFYFGCFDVDDEVVAGTMKAVEESLANTSSLAALRDLRTTVICGVSEDVTGNSWFICTIWLAEYYIARAKT